MDLSGCVVEDRCDGGSDDFVLCHDLVDGRIRRDVSEAEHTVALYLRDDQSEQRDKQSDAVLVAKSLLPAQLFLVRGGRQCTAFCLT